MEVLIAAATENEIAEVIRHADVSWLQERPQQYSTGDHNIRIVVTGVGLVQSAIALTRACCSSRPDMVLLAGIAGAFDRSLVPGDLVIVQADTVGDLGAEDGAAFLTPAQIGLQQESDRWIVAPTPEVPVFPALPRVKGISVNTVTGSAETDQRRRALFGAAVESMEGASAHAVCKMFGIPLVHLRAISNYTGRRDRSAWQIGPAIAALNKAIKEWLSGDA